MSFTYVEIPCPLRGTGSEVAAVECDDSEATHEAPLIGSWSGRWLVQRTADQCYWGSGREQPWETKEIQKSWMPQHDGNLQQLKYTCSLNEAFKTFRSPLLSGRSFLIYDNVRHFWKFVRGTRKKKGNANSGFCCLELCKSLKRSIQDLSKISLKKEQQ